MTLTELFRRDPPPRRHYRNNFLTEVIARADFSSPLSLGNGPPPSFLKAVKSRFPISEPRTLVARELLISKDAVMDKKEDSVEWRFFDADRTKYVNLGAAAVFVSSARYQRFESLQDDFVTLLGSALEPFPERHIGRLGLRYINNIELPSNGDPTKWNEYLVAELTTLFDLADDRSTVSRAFHILEFNYGNVSMRFQFGMHNPDYPAPIRQKVYLLDYDVYSRSLLERQEVAGQQDLFHRKINASFEQVITDKLREKMGPLND